MPTPKFDPTINLGHVLTILALVGSIFVAYTNIVRAVDNHELRIGNIEKRYDRDLLFQEQTLRTLTTIREDIAAMKGRGASWERR